MIQSSPDYHKVKEINFSTVPGAISSPSGVLKTFSMESPLPEQTALSGFVTPSLSPKKRGHRRNSPRLSDTELFDFIGSEQDDVLQIAGLVSTQVSMDVGVTQELQNPECHRSESNGEVLRDGVKQGLSKPGCEEKGKKETGNTRIYTWSGSLQEEESIIRQISPTHSRTLTVEERTRKYHERNQKFRLRSRRNHGKQKEPFHLSIPDMDKHQRPTSWTSFQSPLTFKHTHKRLEPIVDDEWETISELSSGNSVSSRTDIQGRGRRKNPGIGDHAALPSNIPKASSVDTKMTAPIKYSPDKGDFNTQPGVSNGNEEARDAQVSVRSQGDWEISKELLCPRTLSESETDERQGVTLEMDSSASLHDGNGYENSNVCASDGSPTGKCNDRKQRKDFKAPQKQQKKKKKRRHRSRHYQAELLGTFHEELAKERAMLLAHWKEEFDAQDTLHQSRSKTTFWLGNFFCSFEQFVTLFLERARKFLSDVEQFFTNLGR